MKEHKKGVFLVFVDNGKIYPPLSISLYISHNQLYTWVCRTVDNFFTNFCVEMWGEVDYFVLLQRSSVCFC